MKFPLLLVSGLTIALLAGCASDKAADADTKSTAAAVPDAAAPPPAPPVDRLDLTPGDLAKIKEALLSLNGKPPNETVNWYNPDTQVQGSVKVLRDGYDAQNHPCREFHSLVVREPLFRQQTGFVCRQTDGSWAVVDGTDYPVAKRQP